MRRTGRGRSENQDHRLGTFMDAACAVLPRFYAPECCLAATRITVDVLERLHMQVRPLVVNLMIHNPALVAKARPPASAEEALRWRDHDNAAMGICGARGPHRPGRWPGHLVAIVDERFLIDLTLPQMNRPHKDINVPPIMCGVSAEFLAGTAVRSFLVNGCRVFYQAVLDDESYAEVTDWKDPRKHQRAVQAIWDVMDIRGVRRSAGEETSREWQAADDERSGQGH